MQLYKPIRSPLDKNLHQRLSPPDKTLIFELKDNLTKIVAVFAAQTHSE
jgi:hypothetical protein